MVVVLQSHFLRFKCFHSDQIGYHGFRATPVEWPPCLHSAWRKGSLSRQKKKQVASYKIRIGSGTSERCTSHCI